MDDAWELLKSVGLPDGARRRPPQGPLPEAAVVTALQSLTPSTMTTQKREVLLAFLQAWKHHWPDSFSELLGPMGQRLIAELLLDDECDHNKYVKLRRIAIANLANLL